MSATRYDIIATREYEQNGEKKTAYTRIGTAFPLRDKDGFNLIFDALPVAGKALLLPPKPKEDAPRASSHTPPRSAGTQADIDDEIPF